MKNRLRTQIIDLDTGEIFLNELMAEKISGVSRYYIHKSVEKKIPVVGKMFAYFYYGMDINTIKNIYIQNYMKGDSKWKTLTKLRADNH